jgi:hypothetical protein
MNNKKIVVYPVDEEFLSLLDEIQKTNKTDEFVLVTKSIRKYRDYDNGLFFTENTFFTSGRNIHFDVLWIVDSNEGISFCKILVPLIIKYYKRCKIVVTRRLEDREYQYLEELNLPNVYLYPKFKFDDNITRMVYINTPLIMVAGVLPCTDKLKIGLMLKQKLSGFGYTTTLLGSRIDLRMIGEYYSSDYLFSDCYSDAQKIRMLNQQLYKIQAEKSPDVIIAVIPYSFCIDNEYENNDFGVNTYIFSKGCQPDYLIATMMYDYYDYCMENNVDGVQWIEHICDKKTDAIYISPKKLLYEDSEGYGKICTLSLSDEFSRSDWINNSVRVETAAVDGIVKDIIDKLSCFASGEEY